MKILRLANLGTKIIHSPIQKEKKGVTLKEGNKQFDLNIGKCDTYLFHYDVGGYYDESVGRFFWSYAKRIIK